jgi:hypothetical protein
MRQARRLIQELSQLLPATDPRPAPARPIKNLPPNSVRFDAAPSAPIATPVRTPLFISSHYGLWVESERKVTLRKISQ